MRGLGYGARFGRVGAAVESAGADAVGTVLAPQGFVPRDGPQMHQQPHTARPAGARAQYGRLPGGELVIVVEAIGRGEGARGVGEGVASHDHLGHDHKGRACKS